MLDYSVEAKIFKALADVNRLQILEQLQTGEKSASLLLASLSVAQSTLAHHMKVLTETELVTVRRDGKWTYYALNTAASKKARRVLKALSKTKKCKTPARKLKKADK